MQMDAPLITDEFSWDGIWFLPNSQKRISATLKYSPTTGIRLKMFGALGDDKEYIQSIILHNKIIIEPVILGLTLQNKHITLLGCKAYPSITMGLDIPLIEYHCQCILYGNQHFPDCNHESKIFATANIRIPILTEWLCPNTVQHKYENGVYSFSVTGNKLAQSEKSVSLNDDVRIELLRCASIHITRDPRDIILGQDTRIALHSKRGFSLSDINKYVDLFAQFISLSALKLIHITQFALTSVTDPDEIVYYYPTNFRYISPSNKPANFLFSYDDLENKLSQNFAQVLQSWYNVEDEIAPIREQLIESIIDKRFTTHDFLILAYAIDGFHCRFIDKSDNKGYKKRIEELLTKFRDVQKIQSSKLNPTIVCNSRNYYSHFFMPKEGREIYSGRKLYEQTIELRKLLVCCILNLVGFNNSDINTMLNKYSYYPKLSY